MQCRVHAAQLGRLYPEFQAANTEVLVILGDSVTRAQSYANSLKLPFPVLADPEHHVYAEYGLDKAFVLIQRTASLLIDQAGVIRYARQATNPNTWLQESKSLLTEAQRVHVS
jgi:peroxiredoxin Q/BCP